MYRQLVQFSCIKVYGRVGETKRKKSKNETEKQAAENSWQLKHLFINKEILTDFTVKIIFSKQIFAYDSCFKVFLKKRVAANPYIDVSNVNDKNCSLFILKLSLLIDAHLFFDSVINEFISLLLIQEKQFLLIKI